MKAQFVMRVWVVEHELKTGKLLNEVLICQECKDMMPCTNVTFSDEIEDCSSDCEVCGK